MGRIFLIGSIVINIGLIAILAITLNKSWQQQTVLDSVQVELRQTKNQINNSISENKQLLARVSELNTELSTVKNSLFTAQQQLVAIQERPITTTGATKSMAEKLIETLSSGTSVNERILKIKKLGKMLVKIGKAQNGKAEFTPEMMGEMGEMMKIMSEFRPEMEIMDNTNEAMLFPKTREFLVNMLSGMFEELGVPLNKEQMAQYESFFTRMAELDKDITQSAQTATEKTIARLLNIEAINSLTKDMASILTEEQEEAVTKISRAGGGVDISGLLSPQSIHVQSTIMENFKDQKETSKYVLDNWAKSIGVSEEQKNSLKPVAEQYIQAYTALRKQTELTYDKNIMDYYLERNKPGDPTKQSAYDQERENLFQINPDYSKAKTALDIEFLKLRNNYHKQVAQIVGPEKGAKFLNSEPAVVHYPNVE